MPKSIKIVFPFFTLKIAAIPLLTLIAFTLTLAACAAIQNRDAIEMERLLAGSGFQMRLADTPQKRGHQVPESNPFG